MQIIIDRVALDYRFGSVRPPVCPWTLSRLNNHYQFEVIVSVSLISGRMRIIARMQSIGF